MPALSAKIVKVDPILARHLRDTCQFERQRNLSDRNIERLAFEMVEGRFIPGTPLYFCQLPDGVLILVNGNHTLEAICTSGATQLLTFITAPVASLEDVAAIYSTFDIHKARTWLDALKAVGMEDVMPRSDKVASAVGVIMGGFKHNKPTLAATSRAVRFEKMEEYKVAASMLHTALAGGSKSNVRLVVRAAVMAVALETFKHQPTTAFEFWRGLVLDDGLVKGDARKTLLNYLRDNPATGSNKVDVATSKACALAWNAYYANKEWVQCRPNNAEVFTLSGTPWTRKVADQASRSKRSKTVPKDTAPESPPESLPDSPADTSVPFKTGIKTGRDGAAPGTVGLA